MDDTQEILGHLRQIRRDYDDISLYVRGDTYWLRVHSQIDHFLTVIRSVPMGARWCIFLGIGCLAYAAIYRNGKVAAIGCDLLFLSLLFVGKSA